ncbi:PREDICTED: uncharacterized protein LOC109233190 isoform X2 [Nicotiana attenuata]|uniref:START domain-containing protein n=2 Tax=Nicotiana attenuata TaxID=49451 RepID=A0A1J6HZT1_NICAT|nr:PREDICTED: uncharacterized protein LOC109233190 isoform X2 [Nicotiana attenuata]OIS97833.1 hypothetical protein A4A49_08431 [Nicotiana attenuata]
MRDTGNISQYRCRLDQTLSSQDLVNNDMLKTLVKNQILRSSECDAQECSENLVDRRTKEVANFLNMLRSASVTDGEKSESSEASNGGWKIKQDTEEIRVMYREGPEGTPYHTLLAEGYVDGPLDVCLCISWETQLYKKWWPQTTIPTFKVAVSECLQKVRDGEQICLVRMKLSRPLSAREAVVHLFAFEYLQDGLVVVVANSISNLDSVDRSTHGYSINGIPHAQDVVRVDLVGGFALQKVTNNRSYFRIIGNLDIKLDFIPPVLINFVSRQLIGGGFKLYKKEVASVAKGDKDFSQALKDPMYARIREALYSDNLPNISEASELLDRKKDAVPLDENRPEAKVHRDNCILKARDKNIHGEIEEIEDETCGKIEHQNEDERKVCDSPVNQLVQEATKNKNVGISAEVKQALGTLEKAISVIREYRHNLDIRTVLNANVKSVEAEAESLKDSKSSDSYKDCRNIGECSEVTEQEFREETSYEHRNSSFSRRTSSSLCTRDAHHNKIAPESSDVYAAIPDEPQHIALRSSDQWTAGKIMDRISKDDNTMVSHANGIPEKEISERKRKLPRYCCLYFLSGKVVA